MISLPTPNGKVDDLHEVLADAVGDGAQVTSAQVGASLRQDERPVGCPEPLGGIVHVVDRGWVHLAKVTGTRSCNKICEQLLHQPNFLLKKMLFPLIFRKLPIFSSAP